MSSALTVRSFALDVQKRTEIERLNAVAFMPVEFASVDSDLFDLDIRGILSPSVHVWETRSASGFRTLPVLPRDVVVIRLPFAGKMRWRDRWDEHVTLPGQGFLLPFETFSEFEAHPATELLSCTIARDLLFRCHAALGSDDLLDVDRFQTVADFDTQPLLAFSASLRRFWAMAQTRSSDQDMMTQLVLEILIYQLLTAWPRARAKPKGIAPTNMAFRAGLARDYIDANLTHPLTIAEIAGAAGVSVRVLQLSFRKRFDQSPIQYLIGARLDKANEDIRRDLDSTIIDIARRWGFPHPSDFSRRYLDRFGATPSNTRKQSFR